MSIDSFEGQPGADPRRPSFNLSWVDTTITNFERGPVYIRVPNPIERRKDYAAAYTMENAADLTMAEIHAGIRNRLLHKILSEAAKFCLDDYDERLEQRDKAAQRINSIFEDPPY